MRAGLNSIGINHIILAPASVILLPVGKSWGRANNNVPMESKRHKIIVFSRLGT